jgi:signal transduction histidine kinase
MKALTDDLLDLASIESHRFTLRLQSLESRDLIGEALLAASPLAEAKRISLAVESIDTPKLEADPERILRVLSNLLGNAIKFTPEGGTVTLCARLRDGALSVTISDTGRGIAPEDLAHIFDRYWRRKASEGGGSGLGLYIARRIVEAHGGRMWAESSHQGATLIFTLPLESRPERARDGHAKSREASPVQALNPQ